VVPLDTPSPDCGHCYVAPKHLPWSILLLHRGRRPIDVRHRAERVEAHQPTVPMESKGGDGVDDLDETCETAHYQVTTERVTDGARTRDLRSHNPLTSVSERCRMLQKPLI
jgi:hypothetical protein